MGNTVAFDAYILAALLTVILILMLRPQGLFAVKVRR